MSLFHTHILPRELPHYKELFGYTGGRVMLCSIARSLAAHHHNATWHPRCDMPYCVPIRIPWGARQRAGNLLVLCFPCTAHPQRMAGWDLGGQEPSGPSALTDPVKRPYVHLYEIPSMTRPCMTHPHTPPDRSAL